jgi:UDP-glucose 4-epimerase
MKVLVTGGAGYIGSHTLRILSDAGHEVFVLDDLSRGNRDACKGYELFEIDLKDKEKTINFFKSNYFDAVIHFAGYINAGESMEMPGVYFENNIGGTMNLLEGIKKGGVDYLVFSSSAAVYGIPERLPIKEDDTKNPINAYGLTKLTAENFFPYYEKTLCLKYVSLRYFNACGAAMDASNGEAHTKESHLIPHMMRAVLGKSDKFTVYGDDYATEDGSCIRDYIHVVDLANAHLEALNYLEKGGESDAFNVGTGKGYSNHEIVDTVKKITGVNFKVEVGGRRPGDPDELVADNRKVIKHLSWKPKHSDLETIIKTAYEWHKTHPESLDK